MRFDLVTLFPEMLEGPLGCSVIGRGRNAGCLDIRIRDLRDWALGRHRVVDDTPYGGGAGMVLKVEPMVRAIRTLREEGPCHMVLMGPGGGRFDQSKARQWAKLPRIVLLCGHYEGVDDRIRSLVDEELSVGDFVLTGGELAAAVVVDAVARLVPGVVGNEASLVEESFETGLLDHPHYTRPRDFEGVGVPEVLLSGHHDKIRRWRRKQALRRTQTLRPDLLKGLALSPEDKALLKLSEDG